jgi:hypothetical protein
MAFGFTAQSLGFGTSENTLNGSEDSSADTSGNNTSESGDSNTGSNATQGKDSTINQASVNAEAWAMTGGYDPSIATAVSASSGVGVDPQDVEQAAANFAREADRAIREGQTLNDVRTADPNLSLTAQQEIYEKVAQENGTSTAEIEQRAAEEKQQVQQALWGGEAGLLGALDAIAGQNQDPSEKTAIASRDTNNPFAELLVGAGRPDLNLDYKDMGPTTAALASNQFVPMATPGQERERGAIGVA